MTEFIAKLIFASLVGKYFQDRFGNKGDDAGKIDKTTSWQKYTEKPDKGQEENQALLDKFSPKVK